MSMTRLHSPESRCSICQRDGSTVFVYQCTHDDEMNLRDLVDRGELEFMQLFESLWDSFMAPFHVKVMDSSLVAKTENSLKHGPSSPHTKKIFSCNNTTTDKEYGEDRKENIIESQDICAYSSKEKQCHVKYCRNCFPCLEQRSYLELDSIVNGKIPLTSLIAHPEYERPVALARTVSNLGLRPNPNPKTLVSQVDTTTVEDCHITPLSGKTKDIKFDSAFNKSSYLKSSKLNYSVPTRSTPRLYFGPNTRRIQRTSNKFVPTTAPPSPIYVYNKAFVFNYPPIIAPPVSMRKLSSMPAT
ncbi:hypothetical protein EPUL_000959 [Erysiphe pulchra]|uniref:Uncharacterized protein n=1 Tax=Erysiphe pulchra TaxID=225359 RepID=A0A2S4Q1M8_9PEZI|nr:hypothetical protein EPUL_000959 [Erysiphe pulchra]